MSEFPFASAVWADSAMQGSPTTHSQAVQTTRLHAGRPAARFSASARGLHKVLWTRTNVSQRAGGGAIICSSRETFRGPVGALVFAVTKATERCRRKRGRRRTSNFCLLAQVTLLELPAPETNGLCSRQYLFPWGPWAGSRGSCPLAF